MCINRGINHLRNLKKSGRFGRLAGEITVALIIKVLLLWLLWALCFSHPLPEDARQSAVTRMLLNK